VPTPQIVQVVGRILADHARLLAQWEAVKEEAAAK